MKNFSNLCKIISIGIVFSLILINCPSPAGGSSDSSSSSGEDEQDQVSIVIDGSKSDWSGIGHLRDSGNDKNVLAMYTFQEQASNTLFMMIEGANLATVLAPETDGAAAVFLDVDNDTNTGFVFPALANAGMDFLIENGVLYRLTFDPGSPDWPVSTEVPGDGYKMIVTDGIIELSVGLAELGLSGPSQMKVGYMRNYTEFSPAGYAVDIPVLPNPPVVKPNPYVEFVVDGSSDDWSPIGHMKDSGNEKNVSAMYTYQDPYKNKLFVMIEGKNLASIVAPETAASVSIFLDVDNDKNTGFVFSDDMDNAGMDFLIENGILYALTINPADPYWPTTAEVAGADCKMEIKDTCIELSIRYRYLGLTDPVEMKIGLIRNYSEFAPKGYGVSVPVDPNPPVIKPDPYVELVVDGVLDDWTGIGYMKDSGNYNHVEAMYTYQDPYKSKFFVMIKGESLDETLGGEGAVASGIYIDADNNAATGFKASPNMSNAGMDFLIENGWVYAFDPAAADPYAPWKEVPGASAKLERTNGCIEMSISYRHLGLDGPAEMKVGFLRNYSEFSPNGPAPAAPVEPLPVAEEPLPGFPVFSRIPNAIGYAIDDTGWPSEMNPDYYREMIDAFKEAGTRGMAAWVMGGMDKNNICAKPVYNMAGGAPSDMTEEGTGRPSPEIKADYYTIFDMVYEESAWLEFALHAVSHEHWVNTTEYTTEFAQTRGFNPYTTGFDPNPVFPDGFDPNTYDYDNQARSYGVTDNDLKFQAWKEIYEQWFPPEDHSFPEAMVAPAHGWYYGDDGRGSDGSTGSVAVNYGIKYVNNDLDISFALGTASVIDHGVLLIHRPNGAPYDIKGNPWGGTRPNGNFINGEFPYPSYPDDNFGWAETHFTNWFGTGADQVTYMKGINYAPGRYLPKNTEQCSSQWLYKQHASISGLNGTYVIDNTAMVDDAYTYNLIGNLVLKTPLEPGEHIQSASIDGGAEIVGYYEQTVRNPADVNNAADEKRYGYLIIGHKTNPMGRLSKEVYTVNAELGPGYMEGYVDQTHTTYNVRSFNYTAASARIDLIMYGTQTVKVKLPFIPSGANSNNPKLTIESAVYNAGTGLYEIEVKGVDIQGEKGVITIN